MAAGHTGVTLMYGQMVIGLCQDQVWSGFPADGAAATGDISGYPANGDAGTDAALIFEAVKAPPRIIGAGLLF